ncbi:hypothetical protein [Deinococcus wulumuqiensis]|uniref:Uncharacterized protein n=1 Tax=Deinococcus wulumuqiensis TaxID=980427 RepID=A0AAV4K2E1_9DEIO|nr:hypothetical protein [Deinococcus wulumuqiensis]QII21318.1 hypothetical protein G6R31_11645 [Deinococcus wulumuqiensis R12]GGI78737.1 hypothetical protein GCM10010914_11120 [Deinococcus wulumuqiensis]GGP30267.1 hypothetical protein GCM10008021_19180 [Deinococcus wulumuqiensis]
MAWNIHPHWNAPLSPPLWLEIATHGLAPQAAERVRAEHLAHLDDAVDAGESVEDVLREWGDPHRANDAFRKAHLTVTDRGLLHPGYALSAAGWRRAVFEEGEAGRAGMVILLTLLFTVLNATLHLPPAAGVAAALLIVLLVPTLRWLVIAGLRLSGAARVRVAFQCARDNNGPAAGRVLVALGFRATGRPRPRRGGGIFAVVVLATRGSTPRAP